MLVPMVPSWFLGPPMVAAAPTVAPDSQRVPYSPALSLWRFGNRTSNSPVGPSMVTSQLIHCAVPSVACQFGTSATITLPLPSYAIAPSLSYIA